MARKRVYKRNSTKLSSLKFGAIALSVATAFILLGLGLNKIINWNSNQKSVNQTSTAPQSINSSSPPPLPPKLAKNTSQPLRQTAQTNSEIIYNLKTPPNFQPSQKLQKIVDNLVDVAAARNLPTKALSITLIDPTKNEIAGYQQDELRYPASVVKMFWMVALYAQIENKIWANETDFNLYIAEMMRKSDNEAASFIVDQITNTQSQPNLPDAEFQTWLNNRQQLNRFFQNAGYDRINITQKTFPIPYLKLSEPKGTDLQMRLDPTNPQKPIRNKITTNQAARLIYEICYQGQAVSPTASEKMCGWLNRNLSPELWKNKPLNSEEFNPILTFFGESLSDTGVQFYSKAGWTSTTRYESAFVVSADGKTIYILAIAGDDPAYAQSYKIFPRMSRLVFDRMTSINSRS
ncbi:MAG: serine hydrolase [Crinalium sp.]